MTRTKEERIMSKVRVAAYGISLDGYGAGPDQSLENPMGVGGMALHQWVFPTRPFRAMQGEADEGTPGVDDDFARAGGPFIRLALHGAEGAGREHPLVQR